MKTKTKGILSVLGGFMMHLVLGTVYIWGAVNVYVRSYYCYNGTNAMDEGINDCHQCHLTIETVGIVFPLIFQSTSFCIAFAVPLSRIIGIKLQCIVGMILIVSSIFASTFTHNFWFFSSLYGISFGIFSGLIYMLPFNNGHLYFPRKKGLISGLISSGFGVGALIFGQIFKAAINPDNHPADNGCYPREVANNLPDVIRYMCIAYTVIGLGGAFLQTPPSEEDLKNIEKQLSDIDQGIDQQRPTDSELFFPLQAESQDVQENQIKELQKSKEKEQEWECPDSKAALRHPKLYITFIQNYCLSCVGVMLASNYQPYANYFSNLKDPNYIQWVNNVGSVMNFVSRLFWGKMMDIIEFNTIIKILAIGQAIIISTLSFAALTKGTYLFYILMSFGCYGGLYSVMPTQSAKMFGKKVGLTVMGVIFQGFSLATWTEFLVLRLSTDGADPSEKKDIYTTIFRVYWVLPIAGFIMSWFVKYKIDWKKELLKNNYFSVDDRSQDKNQNLKRSSDSIAK